MGKSRRNRIKTRTPSMVPSVDHEEEELVDGRRNHMSKQESTIHALLEMLQSPNAEDKVIGLQTLATIFDAPESVEDVMKHRVVKVAAPLLFDKSTAVRNAAAGALRNLSACGSHEICDMLVEQDVMTPLTALLQKYPPDWQPSKKTTENKLDEVADTFTQSVHLLWNLCESNSTALKYFNDGNLLAVLVKCLEVSVFGEETAIVVAQCLHTVTEDNPTAVNKLQESKLVIERLLELEGDQPSTLLLRTLACGLLLDLSFGKVSCLSPSLVTQLVCNLLTTLSVDHRKALNEFTSSMPLSGKAETSAEHDTMLQKITEMQYLLEAQQTAIELLANICSSDDDDTMDVDMSDSSSDDVLSDSGLMEDGCVASTSISTETNFPLSLPSEVHEAIVSGQLIEKMWNKSLLPAENVCQLLNEHSDGKHILNKLNTLRCRAFLCMNNFLTSLHVDDFGGASNVHEIWLRICNLIFSDKDIDFENISFIEAATSALRAALQKLAELRWEKFNELSQTDLQQMFNAQQKCPDENIRANLIRSIGLMGISVARCSDIKSQSLVNSIGRFLIDICSRETELWVVAETVDTIIDLFGEDETDAVAAELNLVEKLQALLPQLKHKVRLQRKSLGDHYLVVTTVNANLSRFIQYKNERVVSFYHANGHV